MDKRSGTALPLSDSNDASLDMGLPPRPSRTHGRSGRAALTAGTLRTVGNHAAREDVHGNVEVRDFDGYDADVMQDAEMVRQARLRRWQTIR
jgi:hypothetical protein